MPRAPRFSSSALYKALDERRIHRELTWRQVATAIGVSPGTITRLRDGGRMEVDGMLAMVHWLGVPVETFVSAPRSSKAKVDLRQRIRAYLHAIEDGTNPTSDDANASLAFYHPDVRQEELPNQLVPTGAVRDLAALHDAAVRGRKVLRAQRYEVRNIVVHENRAAVEALWVGTLAVPIGKLPAGAEMRAHFGMFLEFEDGLIKSQRNYDCFEPFT